MIKLEWNNTFIEYISYPDVENTGGRVWLGEVCIAEVYQRQRDGKGDLFMNNEIKYEFYIPGWKKYQEYGKWLEHVSPDEHTKLVNTIEEGLQWLKEKLNMTVSKEQLAQQLLNSWFANNNPTITTLELKNGLRLLHPDVYWNQDWVSNFMASQNLYYDTVFNSNGLEHRVYYNQLLPSSSVQNSLTLQNLQDYVDHVIGGEITKTQMKSYFQAKGFSLSNFKELFDQLGLQHTGKYTSDNHKIWKYVPTGKHLSKNKGQLVDIKDMAKPYLRNAFLKLWNNNPHDFDIILDDPNCEEHKLLQAFFTFDIRQKLNQI